ncbi:MAG: TonB-dependent receptor [Elusimicrobiota bacterium]|nr:TonB-dependent receptor [Elusimicrobiota bacterium]
MFRLAALLALSAAPASAQTKPTDEAFRFFAEEGRASTPLKRVAPTQGSPVPVDVVTAEEIAASGAVNLWDLLRFRVGLDVVEGRSSAGSNRTVVSVRGIPRDGIHELLVLLDGRSVYDPLGGTILWERIPVQIQDIERIEIARGPNAALYGSNAGLGVINIITRVPAAPAAGQATVKGGTQRLGELSAAGEAAGERGGLRLSATSRDQGGAPTAADPVVEGHDFLQKHTGNVRGWTPVAGGRLELLAGMSQLRHGKTITNHPQQQDLSHFQTLSLNAPTGDDSSVELRVSRNESLAREFAARTGLDTSTRFWQYDTEGFHTVAWGGGRLHTTYGAGWRYAASRSSYLYGATPMQANRTVRGFLHQSIQVLPTVSVMGGMNHETATAGGYHKDFQGAVLWGPVEEHSFRAAYARANTKPQILHRYADFFANSGAVHIAGNRNLTPSPLTNYELGWRGLLLERALTLELTGFYTEIRDHINLDAANGPGFFRNYTYDNTNTVILRGLEAAVRWRVGPGRSLYSNYTQETVADQDAHDVYVKTTPRHKVNLGFDWALPLNLRASMNAGWKDAYLADSTSGPAQNHVHAFWRVDARLGWSPSSWLELFMAGQNLERPYRREYVDGLLVPRRIQGGATVRF